MSALKEDVEVQHGRIVFPAASIMLALAAALALLAAARLGSAATAAQPDATSLKESLRRLEKVLTDHGSYASGGILRRFDARDFRGCKITYELTPQMAPDHTGYVPSTERTTIDLAGLDPARVGVKSVKTGASVFFATRNGEPGIERSYGDRPHHFGESSRLNSSYLWLKNSRAAEDVRAALARAVELCRK
jgi:hypothetical protein